MDYDCARRLIGINRFFGLGEFEVPVPGGIVLEIHRWELAVILGHSGSERTWVTT